jgi:hypothetical protein
MAYDAKRPEDVIPDDKSYFEKDGKVIRKGTMAAALANAAIVESADASEAEKQQAMLLLKELAPSLAAIGLTHFLTWKNPQIQELFTKAAETNK